MRRKLSNQMNMPQTHPTQVPVNYGRFLCVKVFESLRDIQDLSMR